MKNKSLIIFGCGYVGRRYAQYALQAGASVTALTRNEDKAALLKADGIQNVIIAQLHESSWHTQTPKQYDYALNCVSAGGGGLDGYLNSYLKGMQSIQKWLATAEVGTFVYTSSTGVYPQSDGVVVNEYSESGGSERANILLEAENTLRDAANCLRHFILRLSGIYGPDRHYLMNALNKGETLFPGDGAALLNLIHLEDIVTAITACFLASPKTLSATYNLSDGNPAPKKEMLNWLAEKLGKIPPSFSPEKTSPRMQPPKNRMINTDKIQQELGYLPTYPSYKDGYQQILAKI